MNEPTLELVTGRVLYHGTCATLDFAVPTGPAWFAWDAQTALYWAGPVWAKARRPVAKMYRVYRTTTLLDTRERAAWDALAESLGVEAHTYIMANAVAAAFKAGWIGRTEVLLTRPDTVIEFIGHVYPAENDHLGCGHKRLTS